MTALCADSQPRIRYSAADVARLIGGHPPTAEQAAIIEAPLQPAVIIAGAGSGKTETIATRVVWLIANGLADPDRILGLTFTRKASGELNQRIISRLRRFQHSTRAASTVSASASASLGEPTVSTYAAYASALVDEHGLRLGSEPGATLLTGAARWQLAWDVVSQFDGELHADIGAPRSVTRYVLALADEMANHLISGTEVREFSEALSAQVLALDARSGFAQQVKVFLQRAEDRVALLELVDRFEARKAQRHVRDFADQMRLATRLAGLPGVQAVERAKYDVILLDEYQDTSHSETVLLRALFGDGRPVTAVGDPLQAIYGWRGASASNITGFARGFRPAKIVSAGPGSELNGSAGPRPELDGGLGTAAEYGLMTSWRNDRAILAAANAVAAPVRVRVAATSELGPRPDAEVGLVQVCFADTTVTEANWIADRFAEEWSARQDWTDGVATAAVLVRKRSHIPAVVAALQARGLPVEVLSLGGLLSLPEVVDVISTLKVLTDVRAGTALTRLLTGVRWRLGVADLVALSERGFELARAEQARTSEGEPIGRPEPHLIDALDSLGDPARYSEAGYHRLTAFAHELTALRRRTDQPLPDLIEDIVRVSGLGAELAVRGGTARENLDRLVDEAARFASESAGSVPSFLSYLLAARAEDRGLETAEGRVSAERIQVLTVHGAKGLEWDVVAVPGLADGSFPAEPRGESWTNQRGKVPFELRGDAEALPVLQLGHATKPSEVNKTLTSFISSVNSHRLAEERRLAYVAMTRPRKALYCSGAVWSPGTKSPKKPSAYLVELRDLEPVTTVAGWYQPEPEEKNPLTSDIASMRWPAPLDAVQAADLRAAADLVTRAGADARDAGEGVKPAASRWTVEVDMLLAERRRRTRPERIDVAMPAQLSTSEAVALAEDPASFARRLRRPMPRQPSAAADRGSAFHSWLEQRFSSVALLDIDELFDLEPEAELATLRAAFLAGDWADRVPIAVEVGFELPIGAAIVRGRMDAVFADSDGGFTVVDWKTGRVPTGPDAQAKAVQLAAYRLAWARIKAIPDSEIERVRAAFYYVADNITVYPERLLDASGLRALIMPASPAADTAPGRLR